MPISQTKLKNLQILAQLGELGEFAERQEATEKKQKQKHLWIRPWVHIRPEVVPLYKEIQENDPEKFYANFRFYPHDFKLLLNRISPRITKKDTQMRPAIPTHLRLQVTLRYLSSGANFGILEDLFRIPKSTLSRLIPDTCRGIWEELSDECIKTPQTPDEWILKSKEFLEIWQYPYALAAIDGKHIRVQAFHNSGSTFFNYKGFFSFVLFTAVDAKYEFIFINIGAPGSENDASIWESSEIKANLYGGTLNLPDSSENVQYHLLGDEILPLTERLMKPYSKTQCLTASEKIFNYRHSGARRVVENAFGICASKWRILRNPIMQDYPNAIYTGKAVLVLHNYCLQKCKNQYLDSSAIIREDGAGNLSSASWEREALHSLDQMNLLCGNRSGNKSASKRFLIQSFYGG